ATAAHAPRLVGFGEPATPATATLASDVDPAYVPPMVPASYVDGTSRTVEKEMKRTPARSQGSAARFTAAKDTSPHLQTAGFKSTPAAPAAMRAIHRSHAAPAAPAVPLLRISARDEFPMLLMQQAVFVVTRDAYTGEAVPVLWRVNVWQFMILPQPSRPVESSSKSI